MSVERNDGGPIERFSLINSIKEKRKLWKENKKRKEEEERLREARREVIDWELVVGPVRESKRVGIGTHREYVMKERNK